MAAWTGEHNARLRLSSRLLSLAPQVGGAQGVLTGAHFADGAVTENADLGSGLGRHGDVLAGMVTERPGRVVAGHRHGEGRIWA